MSVPDHTDLIRRWLKMPMPVIEELWGEGDKVVLRVSTHTRHTGEFNGIPATGRNVLFTGIVTYRFRDGKIAESWGELDFAGLRRQLSEKTVGPVRNDS